jgi:hypothetical protein
MDEGARRVHLTVPGPGFSLVASYVSVALVAVIAGAPDSPVTPYLPSGAQALAVFRDPSRWLGIANLSRPGKVGFAGFATVFAATAFGLVLWHAWRGAVSLRAVLVAAISFHVVVAALPVLLAEDVFLYAEFGRIVAIHHANPYLIAPSHFPSDPFVSYIPSEWRHFRPLYGPAFILEARVVTSAIRSVGGVLFAFKLVAVLCSLATMFLVARLARRLWPARAPFALALLGLNPLVLFNTVGGAHNDVLIALCLVGAWALVTTARDRAPPVRTSLELFATGLVTTAAMIKPPLAVVLLLLVPRALARHPPRERARHVLAHLAVMIGVALAFAAPFLQASNPTLGTGRLVGQSSALATPSFFLILWRVGTGTFGVGGWALTIRILVDSAFAAVFVVGLGKLVRRSLVAPNPWDSGELGAAWGWGLLLLLLTAPILLPWYLIWVLPFAWLLPRTPRIAVVGMSLVFAVVSFIAPRISSVGYVNISYRLFELQFEFVSPALLVALVQVLRALAGRLRGDQPLQDRAEVAASRAPVTREPRGGG